MALTAYTLVLLLVLLQHCLPRQQLSFMSTMSLSSLLFKAHPNTARMPADEFGFGREGGNPSPKLKPTKKKNKRKMKKKKWDPG